MASAQQGRWILRWRSHLAAMMWNIFLSFDVN